MADRHAVPPSIEHTFSAVSRVSGDCKQTRTLDEPRPMVWTCQAATVIAACQTRLDCSPDFPPMCVPVLYYVPRPLASVQPIALIQIIVQSSSLCKACRNIPGQQYRPTVEPDDDQLLPNQTKIA